MENDSLANGKGAVSLKGKRTIYTKQYKVDTILRKEF